MNGFIGLKGFPAVEKNRDRAVVDELDVHHGLELAGGDRAARWPQFSHDIFVERARICGGAAGVERRPPALATSPESVNCETTSTCRRRRPPSGSSLAPRVVRRRCAGRGSCPRRTGRRWTVALLDADAAPAGLRRSRRSRDRRRGPAAEVTRWTTARIDGSGPGLGAGPTAETASAGISGTSAGHRRSSSWVATLSRSSPRGIEAPVEQVARHDVAERLEHRVLDGRMLELELHDQPLDRAGAAGSRSPQAGQQQPMIGRPRSFA